MTLTEVVWRERLLETYVPPKKKRHFDDISNSSIPCHVLMHLIINKSTFYIKLQEAEADYQDFLLSKNTKDGVNI